MASSLCIFIAAMKEKGKLLQSKEKVKKVKNLIRPKRAKIGHILKSLSH